VDFFAYGVNLDSHFIVVEPDHPQTAPSQLLTSCNIVDASLMLLAVNLDDKPSVEAYEVDDEPTNRMLAAESQAIELAIAQPPPKQIFSVDRARLHRTGSGSKEMRDALMRHRTIMHAPRSAIYPSSAVWQSQSAPSPTRGEGWGLRLAAYPILAAATVWMGTTPVLAHGSERGFVLLLPTGYYLFGGALAVAASFLLISFVPAGAIDRLARTRLPLGTLPNLSPVPTSLASFVLLGVLLTAGLIGSREPLANPLPLTIWTLWWVGITLLHPIAGNLWACINPWTAPYRLLDRMTGGRIGRAAVCCPDWLGYWPAIVFFFGFAWFELVYPAPDDSGRLAIAVGLYWLVAFIGMLLFGETMWLERAEPFSVFFRLLGGLSPFVVEPSLEGGGRRRIALAVPGAALIERAPMPLSGVFFVLLTLSSVSFDGLSKTFWWLALGDINPLEFPGRSAVVERNTLGLISAFAVLAVVYCTAIRLGWIAVGMRSSLRAALGGFVYSIIPISIAFHFSHYLTALLVDGQYAIIAVSDPFGTGADLLGLGHAHVTTSFLNTYDGVRAIWNAQTAAIVVGHIAAIALAHALALRHFGGGRQAALSQVPLALLMVLYTLFGLWLLSTPVAG
jgi:hypothetical protein